MSKIYVHIGWPKTATTTLQKNVFPNLSSDTMMFAGVFQPRGEKSEKIYYSFMNAVNTGEGTAEVRADLKDLLNAGKSLLISDEMIVVSQPQVSWKNKLINCSTILAGLDYKILVTVREPVSVMYSYYVELFSQWKKTSFSEVAWNAEAMKIYHARYFFDILFRWFDRECIHAICFEDIISGNFNKLTEFFDGISFTDEINLHNDNAKQSSGKITYIIKRKNVFNIIYSSLGCSKIQRFPGARWVKRCLNPAIELLNIDVTTKVKKPSQYERDALQSRLSNETAALAKEFGIEYRN